MGSKLVIIGIDSISGPFLLDIASRGYLPTISGLIEKGCYTVATPFFPAETGVNWAVISTGAPPMVTGTAFNVHLPGDPLDKTVYGFPSTMCKAEQIWTTANRAGKRCIIFDYPQSYPVNLQNGIHVGEDGRPDNALRSVSEVRAYTTLPPVPFETPQIRSCREAHVTPVQPRPARGWANVPPSIEPILEVELPVTPGPHSRVKQVRSLWALVTGQGGRCQAVAICAEKDYATRIATTQPGEWTDWLAHTFTTRTVDGDEAIEAGFRAKLMHLSEDGQTFHLYFSQIYPTSGFASPPEVARDLFRACGPYVTQPCRQQVVMGGAADVQTYIEEIGAQADWYERAIRYLLPREDWDLFIMKWHGSDWTNHLCAYLIDPYHPLYDPKRADEGWDFWGKTLQMGDRIVKAAVEAAGEDAIMALVSDHGGSYSVPMSHRTAQQALEERGYVVRDASGRVDWGRTRAWASGHGSGVYLNVKGREPEGIVEPGAQFEALREEIIQALLDERDPEDGRHLFNLVCRKEDAYLLGIGGDRAPDIFTWRESPYERRRWTMEEYRARYPQYELGTWEWPRMNSGAHDLDAFMVMSGPGLKQGYRRALPTWLSSFAPTLCRAWGIPVPRDAEGGVIWDFLADE